MGIYVDEIMSRQFEVDADKDGQKTKVMHVSDVEYLIGVIDELEYVLEKHLLGADKAKRREKNRGNNMYTVTFCGVFGVRLIWVEPVLVDIPKQERNDTKVIFKRRYFAKPRVQRRAREKKYNGMN